MQRRHLLAAAGLASLPFTSRAQTLEKPKLTLAVGGKNLLYYLPLTIAEQLGHFKAEGLEVTIADFAGGSQALRALVGGSVAISPIATPTVMNAVLAGSDMVILAHTMPGVVQALMVRPDIKRSEDLKGKIVGVTTFGSLTDFLVQIGRAHV